MKHCRSLRFSEGPDYALLRGLFSNLMKQNDYEYDWVFDWVTKREDEVKTIPPRAAEGGAPSENRAQPGSQHGMSSSGATSREAAADQEGGRKDDTPRQQTPRSPGRAASNTGGGGGEAAEAASPQQSAPKKDM
eukprot:TRINITY_DN15799_c0_g1_i2.p1 TRINITY_DN15799_c0_g1~~TRINITY_DN15799_c0_g1_i2.p1  ORF type:complete len:134 (-),score=12.13 TRINITY_DN15799_c0_g1_i2:337-738(-)